MIFTDGDPGPEIRRKLNEMVGIWEQALDEAQGPQGWSPSLAVVADGARSVLQVIDWVGGEGAKPTITGYIGATGIVATAALAVDIRGSIGATGPSNTLAIGTVTSDASPSATITGTSPNQTLNLVLPKGDKGDTGNTGPANTLTIGTVTTGAASATITGTAPSQVLNLVIPQGIQGLQGPQGPKGDTGSQGPQGPQGDTGPQGIQGLAGLHGWTPKFAAVTDGTRRVQQVVDWFGGTGSKPATGEYVGATGLVATAALAVDIRGPAGAGTGSVNPSGTIAANDLAAFADSTGQVIKALKAADLPVSTATQTALNDKAPLTGVGTSGTWPISITGNAATAPWAGISGKPAVIAAGTDAATARSAIGAASLVGGKIPESELPAIAITDVFPVASEAAMLALTAEKGDMAIRSDLGKCFALSAAPASTLANWLELKTPANAVLSVAGRTGAVTLAKAAVGLSSVDNTSDANKPVSTAQQTALNAKQATLVSGSNIKTVNGTSLLGSGNVVTGDVTLSGVQTLANKTLNSPVFNDGYTEEVFAVTGTTPGLSPVNGSIQTWTLTGDSTPTAGTWASGQSMTLMVDDGSAHTINWASMSITWKTGGGTAPTLLTSGYTVIELTKVGAMIYGWLAGDA